MINENSIYNKAKYFYSGVLQNCFVFIPAENYVKYFSGTTQIYSEKCHELPE